MAIGAALGSADGAGGALPFELQPCPSKPPAVTRNTAAVRFDPLAAGFIVRASYRRRLPWQPGPDVERTVRECP